MLAPVADALGANRTYTNVDIQAASNSTRRLVARGGGNAASAAATVIGTGPPTAAGDALALTHRISVALMCIVLGFRILYVFTLSASLGPLLRTIGKMCRKDVVAFGVIYFSISVGFGVAFEFLAREVQESFSTQYRTQYSLLNAMIGEFDTSFDGAYGTTHEYFWLVRIVLLVFIIYGNIM